MMSGNKTVNSKASIQADTARLRYHLTSLYALRPTPDDLLRLIEKIGARAESESD
jgi:hypothetical protein